MSWEKKRYRVVYFSNTEARYRWVEIEKNPYLPLDMQATEIDKAILDAADSVPKDWLFANVYTEENRCVLLSTPCRSTLRRLRRTRYTVVR